MPFFFSLGGAGEWLSLHHVMLDRSSIPDAPDWQPNVSAGDVIGAEALAVRAASLPTPAFLALAMSEFSGRIALVSSFGAEAAVLLHMVASVDAALPVIFLDTGKLFGETLCYRDSLVRRLGLRDVRTIEPDAARIAAADPDGTLWRSNPDRCCALRKVEPLAHALAGIDAWINGRKRSHGGLRAALPLLERVANRVKITPLAGWTAVDVAAYFAAHDLPHHPLEADGYRSIGCLPCTDRAVSGEDPRAGRWRDRDKTECGIHLTV